MLLYAFLCFTRFSHALIANVSQQQEQQEQDRRSLVYRLYLRKPVKTNLLQLHVLNTTRFLEVPPLTCRCATELFIQNVNVVQIKGCKGTLHTRRRPRQFS